MTRDQNPEFTSEVADGVRALHLGQRQKARACFARVVRQDPQNATAWFWLSRAVEDEEKRQECLARVRALDEAKDHVARATSARMPSRPNTAGLRRRRALVLVALLIVAACIAAPLINWGPAQAATKGEPVQASGLIYADQVLLSSEYGGRVHALPVQEGAPVTAGQVVVQLDTSLVDAEIVIAQAAVDLAQAGLDLARAGARPGQIEAAEAQLAQAQAAQVAAAQAVSDTLELVENPQEILLQISVLRARAQATEYKLAGALALKDAAEIGKDQFYEAQDAIREAGGPGKRQFRAKIAEGTLAQIRDRLPPAVRDQLPNIDGTYTLGSFEVEVSGGTYTVYRWVTINLNLPFEAHLAPNLWWQAWIGVNTTAAEKDGIEAALAQLYDQYAQPIELQAQADQAVAALIQAEAQVALAQAKVDGLKAGATEEQLSTLEAQVAQAQAALEALLIKKDQMQIRAPIDGMVVDLSVHEGEVAARGATLVTLANLDAVTLEVYLPETQVGLVHLDSPVQVRVDSFDRDFHGTVSHIADSAQFTPRNVATREERVNLVFAVQIDLDNVDGALKPGMPADATFE